MKLDSKQKSHRHFMIYKPYDYLSQFVNRQNKRRNKKLLGELYDFPEDIMSIGRLDEKSEGLLLLTTNGKFSEHIRSKKIEKEYYVMVDGIINQNAIEDLKNGITITVSGSEYLTKPCKTFILENISNITERFVREERHGSTSWISITLTEGKFRQVRKMTAKVGFPTLRLVRVRIGDYTLGAMKSGDVKEFILNTNSF